MWVTKYTKEVVREGKRVRWPKGEEFWPTFIVVVVISIFAALILFLLDKAAYTLLEQIEKAFTKM